jgi:hypothetical protein
MMEVFVSTDLEADGPIPGSHSMVNRQGVSEDWQGEDTQGVV